MVTYWLSTWGREVLIGFVTIVACTNTIGFWIRQVQSTNSGLVPYQNRPGNGVPNPEPHLPKKSPLSKIAVSDSPNSFALLCLWISKWTECYPPFISFPNHKMPKFTPYSLTYQVCPGLVCEKYKKAYRQWVPKWAQTCVAVSWWTIGYCPMR